MSNAPTAEQRDAQKQLFDDAVEAARRGERARARELLTRLLRYKQDDADIWLWMSAVVDTDRERTFCLNRVLEIAPDNRAAMRGLALLGKLPDDKKSALGIETVGVGEGGAVVSARSTGDGKSGRFKFRRSRRLEYLIVGTLAFAMIALVVVFFVGQAALGAVTAMLFPPPTAGPTATPGFATAAVIGGSGQLVTATPTATPLPAVATPFEPDDLPPFPQAIGLAATPIPTPLPSGLGPVAPSISGFQEFNLGYESFENGDYASAREDFENALVQNPDLAEARYYIGLTYLLEDNFLRAAEQFTLAIELDETYAPAYYGRGLANQGLDNPPDTHWLDAIEADPTWDAPYLALIDFYIEQDNLTAANDLLSDALTALPENASLQARRAQLALLDDDPNTALIAINAALTLDPTLLLAYRLRGEARLRLSDPYAAQNDLNLYTAYAPDDLLGWRLLGDTWQALNDPEAALAAYNTAIALDNRDLPTLTARAALHYALGNLAEAETDYTRIVALAGEPDAQLMLAQIEFDRQSYSRAVDAASEAIALFTSRQRNGYAAQLLLGRSHYEIGTSAAAITAFTVASDLAEDDLQLAEALYWRAAAYALGERPDDALADLDTFDALELPDSDAAATLIELATELRRELR